MFLSQLTVYETCDVMQNKWIGIADRIVNHFTCDEGSEISRFVADMPSHVEAKYLAARLRGIKLAVQRAVGNLYLQQSLKGHVSMYARLVALRE